jgi:hypothetical protein
MWIMFFDRHGSRIDVLTWGRMYEDFEGRVIQKTTVGDTVVITVWLGMDEYGTEPPLIFGSVIHGGKRWEHEARSATEQDALVAHGNLVHLAEQIEKLRNDKALLARTSRKMLEDREAQWRERVGDDAYEEALEYWRVRLTAESEGGSANDRC